jgi:pimeloyl-ACP methyl ester carboxylesterase
MARVLRWTDIKREGHCLTIIKPLCQPDTTVAHAAVMAAAQRPYAAAAFAAAPSGPLAWKTLPCWYLLGTQDKAIPPALQRFMAERANATIVEVPASHVSFVSQPEAATQLILQAVEATSAARP